MEQERNDSTGEKAPVTAQQKLDFKTAKAEVVAELEKRDMFPERTPDRIFDDIMDEAIAAAKSVTEAQVMKPPSFREARTSNGNAQAIYSAAYAIRDKMGLPPPRPVDLEGNEIPDGGRRRKTRKGKSRKSRNSRKSRRRA